MAVATSVFCERLGQVMVEWKIPNFLSLTYGSDQKLLSPTFLLSEATWRLEILPRVAEIGIGCDWMSLFLTRINGSNKHIVAFSLVLKAGETIMHENNLEHIFTRASNSSGKSQFFRRSTMSTKMMEIEMPEFTLTVVCMARLLHAQCNNLRRDGFENLSSNFGELFRSGHQTDVKLKVGEKVFDAHKLVLGARSPVFNAMFQHEMSESHSGVVDILDLKPECFDDFLKFVYTGSFNHVTCSNAPGLYKAADKYDLKDLRKECSLQMASHLTVDNILDVIHFAVTHDETELLDTATEYFMENVEDIFATEKWKTFILKNTELANELLVKLARIFKTLRKT